MLDSQAAEYGRAKSRPLKAVEGLVSRGLSILASFILTVEVARILGPRSGGTFFLLLTTVAVLATVARYGTDNLALKLSGDATDGLDRNATRLIGVSAVIGVITSVACAGVVLTIGHRFASFMSIGLIALAAVVPQALSAVSGAVLRGSGRIGVGAAAELGSIPVLAIAIIFLEAATSRATLTGAIVALVIAAWLTAAWSIPAALITAHSQPTRSEAHPSLTGFLLKRLPQLTWMMGSSLLFYALTWAPVFMLAVTRGPTDVAFFTTAARLAAVIGLVPAVQVTYLAPAFSRLYHLGEIAGLNRLCNRTTWQAMLAAAVPAGVLVAASHPVVVALYGDAFASAGIPLVVLSVAALIAVAAGQTTQLMLLCDLEATALVLNSGWLLGWITIGVVVVTQKGVVGAAAFALASGGVYAGLAILALVRSRGIYSFVRAPAL